MGVFFQRLFGRIAYANVYTRQPGGAVDPIALTVNTRLKFNVEKVSRGFGCSADIDFYNLAPATRAKIETKETIVQLFAGYGSKDKAGLIYQGDVFVATTKRSGADIITTAELLAGGFAKPNAQIAIQVPAGGTYNDAVTQAVGQLQATDPTITRGTIVSLPATPNFPRGFSYLGSFDGLMDYLAKSNGFEWNVNDHVFNLWPSSLGTGNGGFLLSEKTGLIDVPSKDIEGFFAGGSALYHFKSLLNNKLNNGDFVTLQSDNVPSGSYQIYYLQHTGDTHEGQFVTEIEGFYQAAAA
jgi:hypothetical protein